MKHACQIRPNAGSCVWCGEPAEPGHVDSETGYTLCADCCCYPLCGAKSTRASDKIRPIKLNGKAVLSVEVLPQIRFTARECLEIDWPAVLEIANFKADEKAFIRSCHLNGLTCLQAAAELGWDPARARRVQRRIERKLSKGPLLTCNVPVLRRASGVPFEEHSLGSHRAWTLSPPNPIEPVLMRKERQSFFRSKPATYENV